MKEEKRYNYNSNRNDGGIEIENVISECEKNVSRQDGSAKKVFGNPMIVFGTIIVAAILISLKTKIVCKASDSEQYDLSVFIGQNYEKVADEIGGMSETKYSMTWLYKDNEWFCIWGDDVKRINYIQAYGNWTLCGLRPDMSDEEMEEILNEQGFTELWQDVYYDDNERFVILSERVNKQAEITFHEVSFGGHSDLQDLFTYIEQPMKYAAERIPDLEYCIENDNVYYKKNGVKFIGSCADGVLEKDVIIEKIIISGEKCPYSIYGVCPGDSEETDQFPNFDEGGTGESLDPGGHLLLTINSEAKKPGNLIVEIIFYGKWNVNGWISIDKHIK